MHYVEKGTEPAALKSVRRNNTERWVEYYSQNRGSKPSDSSWRRFHKDLSREFFGLCAYCERECKGEVEHFRPKSKFPKLVYEWVNWVLACHDCNNAKSDKWPAGGYVYPCEPSRNERPETYFTFDTKTGEILPAPDLNGRKSDHAWQTIDDLKLNAFHLLKGRLTSLRVVAQTVELASPSDPELTVFVDAVTAREAGYSSITRMMLAEDGLFSE